MKRTDPSVCLTADMHKGGTGGGSKGAPLHLSEDWTTTLATFERVLAVFRRREKPSKALDHCMGLIERTGPREVVELLELLPSAWADHAITSIYALMMAKDRRKRLGAYFTPPHLVDHLVSRLKSCGVDPILHRLRDPAAGGAAFLVPLARVKVGAWKAEGCDEVETIRRLRVHLVGREIEPELATLANALLRRMLVHEFGVSRRRAAGVTLVKTGDSLDPATFSSEDVDHEIGNPPFLRLGGDDPRSRRPVFGEVAAGRANLYALFVRRALEEVPVGGLVGYVIPTSFLGGPEFLLFRKRILQLAKVLVIDLVEKRSDVFIDVIQDACFLILRRRETSLEAPPPSYAESGRLERGGRFVSTGLAEIQAGGAPWRLP